MEPMLGRMPTRDDAGVVITGHRPNGPPVDGRCVSRQCWRDEMGYFIAG
jgi:hypothetical protein